MIQQITLPISGMSCYACAQRIERQLQALPGVQEVRVNLASEEATIHYESKLISPLQFHEKIRSWGFDIVHQTVQLSIVHMSCITSAITVEQELKQLPGIIHISVNFALESAHIRYIPHIITCEQIISHLQQMGFQARRSSHQKKPRPTYCLWRWIIAALCSFPFLLLILNQGDIQLPLLWTEPWGQFLLASFVQFVLGAPFHRSAWQALKNQELNIDLLVVTGTLTAYTTSLLALSRSLEPQPAFYFGTSMLLITLLLLGRWLEYQAIVRTTRTLQELSKRQPKTAKILHQGKGVEVLVHDIQVDNQLIVHPGEVIPVDGVVIEGITTVDESSITGDESPVMKRAGDRVYGVTRNQHGYLLIRATSGSQDTLFARMLQVVEVAQTSKASIQQTADRLAVRFIPIIFLLAMLTFAYWYFWGRPGQLISALQTTCSVLLIACPCTMAIVAPIGVLIGSGRALQAGILFKSGEQIELAHDVNTVVVNKTSLTQGKSVVTDIQIIGGYHEQDWLQWVASVESKAQHPIGRAIVQKAKAKGLTMLPVEPFSALPGYGVHGKVAGHAVTIGTRKLLRQQNVSFASAEATIQSLEARGKTVVLIAIDQTYAGLIAIDDPLKPSVETAVKQLTENGVGVHLLTADSYRTAQAIAQQTGIKHVIAEVLPSHKGAEIQRLRQQGKKVAMIGDATTDADALAKADLGIVLTTEPGSHLDRRQLTLLSGDLSQLVDVIQLSRQIIRNIKRGFRFALAYHLIGIPLAALGFLAPWCAVFVMVCSSIAIVGNAFHLQRKKKTTLDIGCGKAPSM